LAFGIFSSIPKGQRPLLNLINVIMEQDKKDLLEEDEEKKQGDYIDERKERELGSREGTDVHEGDTRGNEFTPSEDESSDAGRGW
jgi:hypothetical protein